MLLSFFRPNHFTTSIRKHPTWTNKRNVAKWNNYATSTNNRIVYSSQILRNHIIYENRHSRRYSLSKNEKHIENPKVNKTFFRRNGKLLQILNLQGEVLRKRRSVIIENTHNRFMWLSIIFELFKCVFKTRDLFQNLFFSHKKLYNNFKSIWKQASRINTSY